jgi:hypothetical protein
VLPQEEWPDNLGHFGDWRKEVKDFHEPLNYSRRAIV